MDTTRQVSEKYHYTCGAGGEFNRYLVFTRPLNDDPCGVQAKAYAYSPFSNSSQLISCLNGNEISVEMMSTSEKMQALMAKRRGEKVLDIPSKPLSYLSREEQDNIFRTLGTFVHDKK